MSYFEILKEEAKQTLVRDGSHIPIAIVGGNVLPLIFRNDDEKELILKALQRVVLENRINQYYIITENWITPVENGQKMYSERKQTLIVMEINSDMTNKAVMIEFENDNEIKLGKETNISGGHNIWNVYLEREGVKERMEKELGGIR